MDSWGTDWWRPSEQSGPSFSGTLGFAADPPQPAPQGRISERVPIEMGAGLRQRGASGVSVQIMDLSTHGFRAATHLALEVGTDVWLRLPGLEASHAKVAWQKGYMVGCAFERPLHPAVLEMIVRKSQGR